jgi:hypothetical protein
MDQVVLPVCVWLGALASELVPSISPLLPASRLGGFFVKSGLAVVRRMSRRELFMKLRLRTQPVNVIPAMRTPFAKPDLVGAPLYLSSQVLHLHS